MNSPPSLSPSLVAVGIAELIESETQRNHATAPPFEQPDSSISFGHKLKDI